MSDATSIFDLPTDLFGGENINIKAQEKPNTENDQHNQSFSGASGMSLDQTTINQIVNGLQKASMTGSTQLPSRDIPMTTSDMTSDPEVMPNYLPPPLKQQKDYIKNDATTNDIITNYNKVKQTNDNLDYMYNEIQVPILLSVLYFLFQLPFFKRFLFTYMTILFSNDGNYNINGYVFTSVLFGLLFHLLTKITSYFGTF